MSAARLGMKHVMWVRVVSDGTNGHAEVHGLGHRLPRTVRVSLATASALVAGGVPLLVHRNLPAPAAPSAA